MDRKIHRKLPVGAEVQSEGVHFRVWAPESKQVSVELQNEAAWLLQEEGGGYYSGLVPKAAAGSIYRIGLESGSYPDPASRFQPEGPHGPSQVWNSDAFVWSDAAWRGRKEGHVISEIHIGTFTQEGTWRSAMDQLPELARIGITMIEVMPIADFSGRFGWGYDGVNLYAPCRLYGSPDDLRRFVDRAHQLKLMVILDVVYNHLGPDGNYLSKFSKHYFSSAYDCEWGQALNFDGENSGPVREYYRANAGYWIDEFHFDGLRLDATQQIFDQSKVHILAEVTTAARQASGKRFIFLVGENQPQESRLLQPAAEGGCGLDALWNDDFHHSGVVAATGRGEAYYFDYKGTAQEFVSALKYGFLYQGQWNWRQRVRRGTSCFHLRPHNFAIFLENHDQVANSLRGSRLHQLTSPAQLRALTAVMLLAQQTPLLFQGQEFAASAPFLYFADHSPELHQLVTKGRREFLSQFRTIASEEGAKILADPGEPETFRRCKLDHSEREKNQVVCRLHEDLLRLRREDPCVARPDRTDGAVLGEHAFVFRYFSERGDDRLLLVNLGSDLYYNPAPEPLLGPPDGCGWQVGWSSESPEYGGSGTPPVETIQGWIILGHSAVLMKPKQGREPAHARLTEKD